MFVYGFDDFTELELDALETLATRCGAYVCVSLPFEPGREAFRATAAVHARLSEIATDRIELAAVDDHYAPGSRAALHQVERGLFESDPPPPVEAGDAIAFHSAGGARAEVELAAARVLDLLRGGTAPGRRGGGVPRSRRATRRSWSRCSGPTACPTRSTGRFPSPTPASAAGCSR